MIYLFAGDDIKKRINTYENFLKSSLEGAEIFFINKNNFDLSQIENFFSGENLFFKKCAVVFLSVLEKAEIIDLLIPKLTLMGKSKNSFIFSEGKLDKGTIDEFKKARAELNIFELPKEKQEKFNNFLLTYAFEERDKFKLWLYFRQAMDLGIELEPLAGVLFWKAKDMILKKNFRNFTENELVDFAGKISYLLPETRRQGIDDESAFEKFILESF